MDELSATATYRIQLRKEFGFDAVAELAAYLVDLGVSHVYLSPCLQAAQGSTHGYDVVDPGRVNAELGGASGRERMCKALASAGLRQVLDIVPNHMAIRGGENAWWWDVLENGPSSRYSSFFDVEWRAVGSEQVLLPILGDQYGVELENGLIRLEREGPDFFVRYHEHSNPVAPRSLGHLLRPVAQDLGHDQLAFVADTLVDLPSPNVTDLASRGRRHRDKQMLRRALASICESPDVARAIDDHLARTNASADALHEVLERQLYRLAFWKVGNHELDYRRFFDIDSLVGLRVEEQDVLETTHALVLKWLEDGSVDALRIDHIDGLYDPQEYLERLRQRAPRAWILVEKILEPGESLPPWPVEGTTGYEVLNQIQRVLVDPSGEQPLSAFYAEILCDRGGRDYAAVLEESKRKVLREGLASDVRRLGSRLAEICQRHRRHRDHSRQELETAIIEICVAFSVYRAYATQRGGVSEHDRVVIQGACERAIERNPELDPRLIVFLQEILCFVHDGSEEAEFAMRFQQLTGPAMAKGAEDTAFYRYHRLVALNEVGGDPGQFSLPTDVFHEAMARRQARSPRTLTATSTHDTKRSEDVRARLLVLSEIPGLWREYVMRWKARLAQHKTPMNGGSWLAPDESTEYALLQNLVGAWPITHERFKALAEKAVREAKLHSSWRSANPAYEEAVLRFVDALFADADLCTEIDRFVSEISTAGQVNALNQTLLKMMIPGIPDIYQGTELWDFSLVDPDNRRPVDYGVRRSMLAEISRLTPEELWRTRDCGAVKLHFVQTLLELRNRRPECFGARGTYTALAASGTHADRVIAFSRGASVVAVCTRWWMRHGPGCDQTKLRLPPGTWRNVLTRRGGLGGQVALEDLLGPFPAAALEREDGGTLR